jgi:putative transposase
VIGQPRSTRRLPATSPSDEELALRAFLRDFSIRRPRWGWRRAATPARKAGWTVNNKRIHRLWIAEGLRVPYRKRKRPPRGIGAAVGAMCPIRPNVLWAVDFQFDQTSDARMLKALNVIDEFTREALAVDTERSIDADNAVVARLERLAAESGAPLYVRFDNGPEFIAHAVADWCRFNGTDTVFIDPGSPWQNAWVESFNGRLRDEFLNGQRFDSCSRPRSFSRTGGSTTTCTALTAGSRRSSSLKPGSTNNRWPSHWELLNYRGPLKSRPKAHGCVPNVKSHNVEMRQLRGASGSALRTRNAR